MNLNSVHLTKDTLAIKLNAVVENTIEKIKLHSTQVPLHNTTNDNLFDNNSFRTMV